jgi:hypothetical protein
MMYLPLMHEFMKLMEMLDRVIIYVFSKYGKTINPLIHRRNNIWKNRNNREIKRSKPSSQDFFYLELVESPVDLLTMELPGE